MRDHVRHRLDDAILDIYKTLRYPVFPVDPDCIVRKIYHTRYITYDQLAAVSGVGYRDIVKACRSLDGCTHYDPKTGRFLVAINTSPLYGASRSRIRWTTAHELGHICAGHFFELEFYGVLDIGPSAFAEMEEEADYFAASFLAPIPAIKFLRVKKPADIRDWFGLSQTAAEYRWTDYRRSVPDPRVDDYFHIFRPRSMVKEAMMMNASRINIKMDEFEEEL